MDDAERRARRRQSLLFWVSAVANALPLCATRYLPFTDFPEHTAAMATIARLLPGGGGAPYELALEKSQYLLFHVAGAVIARLVGDAILANRGLLLLVAVAWPLSMRSLLRAFDRDERLSLFAGLVFWNRATTVGLEPFIASVPLLLYSTAAMTRQVRAPTIPRGVALVVLTLALFYTHASSFLLFTVIACALAGEPIARAWRAAEARASAFRRALEATVAVVPAALVALVWARVGGLKTTGPGAIERMEVVQSLVSMPIWTFDVWQSHLDEVSAGLFWAAYLAIVLASWREPPVAEEAQGHMWLPFACTMAVYLTIPTRIGDASMLNVRLAPIITLFALLGLRVGHRPLARAGLALVVLATVLNAGNTAFEMRRIAREVAGDFDVVLDAMKPNTRVAMLNFEMRSPRAFAWPYPFAGAYHVAHGGAVASFSFAELPHWSVRYAPNAAPPEHAPFWVFDPCAYRFRADGRFYDYVLVQGDVAPFEKGRIGPHFSPLARSGRFTLYGKTSEEPEPDAELADDGPCSTATPNKK